MYQGQGCLTYIKAGSGAGDKTQKLRILLGDSSSVPNFGSDAFSWYLWISAHIWNSLSLSLIYSHEK